jgi:hypothetical protein
MLITNEVRIETSTLCNYSCKICPLTTDAFTRRRTVMSQNMFEEIIKKVRLQMPQINVCTLSGMGEVFTDSGIITKSRYAAYFGFDVHILTNGSLLTEDLIDDLLSIPVASIRISFHTPVQDHYSYITGSSVEFLSRLSRNIEYLSKNRGNTRLIITSDLTENFFGDVEAIKKFCLPLADLLEIWRPHNWSNWGNFRNGRRQRLTCGRPFRGPLQIQVDGTINMCCFDFNGELLLGDFKKDSIKNIFSSDIYQRITKFHHDMDSNDNILCKNCDQLYPLDPSILVFNSGFEATDRINKTSTIYQDLY